MSNLTINIPPQALQAAGNLTINLGSGVNGRTEPIMKRPYVRRAAKAVTSARVGRPSKRNNLPSQE